jgi:hypothetical protein
VNKTGVVLVAKDGRAQFFTRSSGIDITSFLKVTRTGADAGSASAPDLQWTRTVNPFWILFCSR